MSKLLGIIDAIEAQVLEAKKVPFSKNVILCEDSLFELIDKLRTVAKELPAQEQRSAPVQVQSNESTPSLGQNMIKQSLQEEELEKIKQIQKGADEYADYVLSNLQLSVTKMRKNLIRLENNIENGREVLEIRKQKKETSVD